MSRKSGRKKYVLSKDQYIITAIIVLYNVLAISLAGILVFLPSIIGLLTPEQSSQQLAAAKEILVLHKRFWPAILIVATVLGAHSIFFFHRFFGPLYKFKETLKKVSKGDLSVNIQLRKKDFLAEEKEVVNSMVSTLRVNISELKQHTEVLSANIAELENSLNEKDVSSEEIQLQVKDLKEKAVRVCQNFGKFKLS